MHSTFYNLYVTHGLRPSSAERLASKMAVVATTTDRSLFQQRLAWLTLQVMSGSYTF